MPQPSDLWNSIVGDWAAAFQQSSPVSRHLKILEERFMQADENILTLTRACQNLRTILEQYELINQELATQVIDLRTKLKTP